MHTPLCHHATGEPVDYSARAVEIGLSEIGFSDHSPMERDDFDDWRMLSRDLDSYVGKVREAQDKFPQLTIKLGLEVDYLPGHENWIRTLAARHPWDYFIGSVHYVADSWDFDNPKKLSRWKERDPFEVWSAYFARLTAAAESGLFQIIGHADLAKKFCFYPKQDCTRSIRWIFGGGEENEHRARTQHCRPAKGLPGNLSEPSHCGTGFSGRSSDYFWVRCARTG